MNMLLYSRPQRSELDAWKTPGWSSDEILKYMNKVCLPLQTTIKGLSVLEAKPLLVGELSRPSRIRRSSWT